MKYPCKIAEPGFQFGRTFQGGWGELSVGETELGITGKGRAGFLSSFLLGWVVASAVAGKKTSTIAFANVVNVSVSGKKLTVEYTGEKGKTRRIRLQPFQSKGFFGGKKPQAQQVYEMIQEKCAR